MRTRDYALVVGLEVGVLAPGAMSIFFMITHVQVYLGVKNQICAWVIGRALVYSFIRTGSNAVINIFLHLQP